VGSTTQNVTNWDNIMHFIVLTLNVGLTINSISIIMNKAIEKAAVPPKR
jgi:hypothetical protein